jgi:dihydrofolate reductase
MREIIVVTYMTMDGVLQAPGGPEEDRSNGFQYGGWMFPYVDEQMGGILDKIMSSRYDLLLGRRTYEIFSAYWPYKNDKIGETFTRVNKYVVATTSIDLSWKNSILINKDVVNEIKKLKEQDGPDLLIWGSGRLLQTLFSNRLVDELHTWTFPIILGKGKRLFEEGVAAQEWKLTESTVSTTGVVIATYVPNGEVKLGSFVEEEASDAELARRKKWSGE